MFLPRARTLPIRRLVLTFGVMIIGAPRSAWSSDVPTGMVLVTENAGANPEDVRGALAAAIDAFQGTAELGTHPEKAETVLKGRGSDPFKCGGEAACLAQLGQEVSAKYVLAIGLGQIAGTFPVSVTLVDVALRKVVKRQTAVLPGRPDWADTMREMVDAIIPDGMRRPTARLEVRADVDDAEVLVDGATVGRTPLLRPIPVAAGVHKVIVRKQGHFDYATSVEVEPMGSAAVQAKVPAIPPPPPKPPPRPLRTASYVVGGAALVGVGLSIWTGVRKNQAASAFLNECQAVATNPEACDTGEEINVPTDKKDGLVAALDQRSAANSVWVASMVVTGVVAAAAVGLFAWDYTHPPKAAVAFWPGGVTAVVRF